MIGWKTNKLSSLGVIQTGSTPKTSVKENFGNFIPFIKPADFQPDGVIKYKNDGLSEKGLAESRLIKQNSVVMVCIGATIGKVGYTTIDVTSNQQINSFTPFDGLLTKYCYYAMLDDSFKRRVIFSSGQATLPIINKTKWSNLELTYPDNIEEQKRIVAILDQAFADIELARAKTEQNLKNARELFESYLNIVFDGLAEFSEKPLQDLCGGETITYGVIKLGEHIENGIPCLRTSNVRKLFIETEGMKKICPTLSSLYGRTVLKGNEVLVNVRGTLGGVVVVPQEMVGWNISREVAVVPIDIDAVDPSYIACFIASKASQDWLTGVLKGAAYTGINLSDLRNLPIKLPRISEQVRVVGDIGKIKELYEKLEGIYTKKIRAIDELKKSILQKAFSGELTKAPAIKTNKGAA